MPQISKSIEARLIEFRCERCEIGVYRSTGGVQHAKSCNQWDHRCSHCGDTAIFTVVYPLIEYKTKWFALADHMRHAPSDNE